MDGGWRIGVRLKLNLTNFLLYILQTWDTIEERLKDSTNYSHIKLHSCVTNITASIRF